MGIRTGIIFKSNGWRRAVASLLILSWVNVAAQPCLMVMDASPDAVAASGHGMHAAHQSGLLNSEPCEHCPTTSAASSTGCAAGISANCGGTPEFSAESRKVEFKVDDCEFGGVPTGPPDDCNLSDPDTAGTLPDPGLLKRRTGPTLSIQYCVFLK